MDTGAIIAQEAVEVDNDDTEESLTEKIKVAEHKVFPHALQLVATGIVSLNEDNSIVWSI